VDTEKTSCVRVLKDMNRLLRKGRNLSLQILKIQLDCPLQLESWFCFEQGTGFYDLQKSFLTKFQAFVHGLPLLPL